MWNVAQHSVEKVGISQGVKFINCIKLNMTNQSNRHHYIPKFYLNNFTNKNKELSIYNCETKEIKHKYFSPKTHFFEQNRNSFQIGMIDSDSLEKIYSYFDDKNARLFEKIKKENYQLNIEDIFKLQQFISNTFWRVPVNDNLRELIKNSSIQHLGLTITNKEGEIIESEFMDNFVKHPAFIETMRCYLPLHNFKQDNLNLTPQEWKIYECQGESFHFCSDNPIIRKSETDVIDFSEDFIFPLTKKKLLVKVKANSLPQELDIQFWYFVDILLLLQSLKYVGSASKEYLSQITLIAHKFIGKEKELKEIIFNYSEYVNISSSLD